MTVTASVSPRATATIQQTVKRVPLLPKKEMTRKEKRQFAYNMRVAGHTVKGIATVMGISEAKVARLLRATMTYVADTTRTAPDALRALELERLDHLIVSLWALRKEAKVSEVILKVLERRHKLSGLEVTKTEWRDMTKKAGIVEVEEEPQLDVSLLDAEEKEWLAKILAKAAPAPPQIKGPE